MKKDNQVLVKSNLLEDIPLDFNKKLYKTLKEP